MEIKKAVEILEDYQKWRLGSEIEMRKPKIITEALNALLAFVKKANKKKIRSKNEE